MSHSLVYVEFGATSSDTIALTHTLGSTTSTLKWNILAQQIPCTANYRCHKFLVQKGTKIVLVWTNDLKGHRQTACNGSPEPQGLYTATTMLEARSVSKDTLDYIHYWWLLVVMVDLLDGVYNVFTHYAPSSSTRKTTRTASELRTGSVGSSGRRRVGRLTVSARWEITFLLVFAYFKYA